MSDDSKMSDHRGKLLAFVTYGRFLKNAWKKRKEIAQVQDVYLKSNANQIKNLKMQVVSLKSLLTSDEQIMRSSMREINSLKILLASLQEEYTNVKAEKEDLERKSEDMNEELTKTLTELRNEKNNYILIKSEALAYEAQLEKEREKIAELKKDNKLLISKLETLMPRRSSNNNKNSKNEVLMEVKVLFSRLRTNFNKLQEIKQLYHDFDYLFYK